MDSADFSQKAKQKAAISRLLQKLRPGLNTSLPLVNEQGLKDQSFEIAVMEVIKESGGLYTVLEMGKSITIGRTLALRGVISAEAMEHLEAQGRAISAETAMARDGFNDGSVPKDDSPFTDMEGLSAVPFVPET